jgi:hypothetical protein
MLMLSSLGAPGISTTNPWPKTRRFSSKKPSYENGANDASGGAHGDWTRTITKVVIAVLRLGPRVQQRGVFGNRDARPSNAPLAAFLLNPVLAVLLSVVKGNETATSHPAGWPYP